MERLPGDADTVGGMSLVHDRQAGICMHITSLPGPYGVGDIGRPAHEFVSTLRSMGMRVWQFLPLGPVGYGNSPYQPLSIYAGNEMLIGIEELIAGGFISHDEAADLRELPAGHVDYARLIPLKSSILSLAAGRFMSRAGDDERDAFERFIDLHDAEWLDTYSLFRVLKSMHDEQAWTFWPERYLRRDADALSAARQAGAGRIHKYKVLQFWFFQQWQRLRESAEAQGLALMGDIPIYIALDSADAWAHTELLSIDADGNPECVAGVPPDYFSADGQLWGNPVYDWSYHDRTGFTWWRDRIRYTLTMVDLIRLDHFRGFESYWSIPAGARTAREGEWRAGPADRLFEALKEDLGELPLIAEDLGIITEEVKAFLRRWGFPGMKVLQFMVDSERFDENEIDEHSVCYTGTHDNDTTVGWFLGTADEQRNEEQIAQMQDIVLSNIHGARETIHMDMIRFALNSRARLCIFPLQDLLGLGSEARMNTPGTTENNWNWRLSDASAQLDSSFTSDILQLIEAAGRRT